MKSPDFTEFVTVLAQKIADILKTTVGAVKAIGHRFLIKLAKSAIEKGILKKDEINWGS